MVNYLNLPEIFYLGVYQPLTGECEGDFDFTEYTSRILNLKNCKLSVIEDFADCISSNLENDFDCIVVVPPHHKGKDNSGIKILAQEIAHNNKLIDATSCLSRTQSIDRLSAGGDRSLETHLQSINVINREVVKGKKMLILDDVSTTGNSLKACQNLLESAGANSVKCLVLGKTTRYEEDLEFFDEQYEVIKQSIEEELAYLQGQVENDTYYNHIWTEYEYEAKMDDLSKNFDYGNLSDADFDYFAFELVQSYREFHQKIDYECALHEIGISNDAAWQMQALNNLYKFSFN